MASSEDRLHGVTFVRDGLGKEGARNGRVYEVRALVLVTRLEVCKLAGLIAVLGSPDIKRDAVNATSILLRSPHSLAASTALCSVTALLAAGSTLSQRDLLVRSHLSRMPSHVVHAVLHRDLHNLLRAFRRDVLVPSPARVHDDSCERR